jgi:superfamily II RNA helicase
MLEDTIFSLKNKKRKEADKRIKELTTQYKSLNDDKKKLKESYSRIEKINKLRENILHLDQYLGTNVDQVINIITELNFAERSEEGDLVLSEKGRIASQFHEVHCLVFAEFIQSGKLFDLTSKQLIGLFSCFTNLTVPDDLKAIVPRSNDSVLLEMVKHANTQMDNYYQREVEANINSGTEYDMTYDLLGYIEQWCDCNSEGECRLFLQKLDSEKQIFLGEFTKAVMKILNVTREMEKVAELIGRVDFLKTLREIPGLIAKFVATNQSLYI